MASQKEITNDVLRSKASAENMGTFSLRTDSELVELRN